jgi:putative ABC transport system permease protein
MNLKNTFLVAIKAIWTNKVRSFLTTLGVIIGVFSVVMLMSIGKGLEAYVTEEFEALGSNNIFILPGKIFSEDGGFNNQNQASALTSNKLEIKDLKSVKKLKDFVDLAIPASMNSDTVSFQNKKEVTTVVGTTHQFLEALNRLVDKGRFFTKEEEIGADEVVCLGHSIAEDIFGNIDPIGKKVRIGTQSFKVIGVIEKQGGSQFGGPNDDAMIFIPLDKAFSIYDTRSITEIFIKVKKDKTINQAITVIEKKLLERLDEDEFSVIDQAQILETINNILGIMTIGLTGIAAISLLVGGIGIMNIMLVSVTERTREIGLRKALGATPNQILVQFIIESAFLSILGGLIGLILAFLGSLAIQNVFPAKITIESIVLAFGVSTLVGLIFGASPARRASKLSPIEALRYE